MWVGFNNTWPRHSQFSITARIILTQYDPQISVLYYIFRWGCTHEKYALKAYENQATLLHENLVVKDAGLHIHCEHPFLGASPDSHVECSCCREGVLEVKCPYCAKNNNLEILAQESKQFCLKKICNWQSSPSK